MEEIEMNGPVRKKNRLEIWNYSSNGAYFITICTQNRQCMLSHIVGATIGRPAYAELTLIGMIVKNSISQIETYYPMVKVEHYVIMPNHIHLLLMINTLSGRPMVAPTISRVIAQMKGYASKQIGYSIWQKSFHDHIIRSELDYQRIWSYIDTNPARWKEDCFYMEE